jgi:hypothetical protein
MLNHPNPTELVDRSKRLAGGSTFGTGFAF